MEMGPKAQACYSIGAAGAVRHGRGRYDLAEGGRPGGGRARRLLHPQGSFIKEVPILHFV